MLAIGAGVNEWQVCEKLLGLGDFDCFLLAGRYTLLEQEALETFLPLCESRDVGIILGGPYNSGILATGAVEGARYNYVPAPPEILERVRKIESVCREHGTPLIAAALQFVFGHPCVKTVIPGAVSRAELLANAKLLEVDIPESLWTDLKSEGLIRIDAPALRINDMLRNIPPILSPDLLHALAAMGHGDDIVIADANFPAESSGVPCIRLDGISATDALEAILSLLPLDSFVPDPALVMQVVGDRLQFRRLSASFRRSSIVWPIIRLRFKGLNGSPSTIARLTRLRWFRPASAASMETLS